MVNKSQSIVSVEVYASIAEAQAQGDYWYGYYFSAGKPDSTLLARDTHDQIYCEGTELVVDIRFAENAPNGILPDDERYTPIILKRGVINYYQINADYSVVPYQP